MSPFLSSNRFAGKRQAHRVAKGARCRDFRRGLLLEALEIRQCLTGFYDFEIIAQTGSGLTAIQPAASINDSGDVAFVAATSAGQSVYVGDGSSAAQIISFANPSSTRTYGQELQINNAGQVGAVDILGGQRLARTWESGSPGTNTIVARSSAPLLASSHFDALGNFTSMTNDGQLAFAALESDEPLPPSPSSWEIHLADGLPTAVDSRDFLNTEFSEITTLPAAPTFFRFMAADGDRVVIGSRDSATGPKRIELYEGAGSPVTIASTTGGAWSDLGVRPGISDDGQIVTFYGVEASDVDGDGITGPGIFASVQVSLLGIETIFSRELVRVAGIAGNGQLDPGETFADANGNGILDAGEIDEGPFSDFLKDSRVGVTNRSSDLDAVSVAFGALNSGGDKALYTNQLTFLDAGFGSYSVGWPSAVVELGQAISNIGIVSDLAIHDPINNDGQLAFWVNTGGSQAIVTAKPVRKPVLVLPGIAGTFFNENGTANSGLSGIATTFPEWLTQRGIHPARLTIDPLANAYSDQIQTLKNAGYKEGVDLFVANYDWRVDASPFDGNMDGVVDGLTTASLTDNVFEYGVDYLGYWLNRAKQAWAANHNGDVLKSVDLIVHSTGGLVARSYIQSPIYGVDLPKVDNFIQLAVPNLGASKAWNPLHDNWVADGIYRVVLSKLLNAAYDKLVSGDIDVIEGPDPSSSADDIFLSDIENGTTPDPIEFISLYVPTIRSLLATYDFLDLSESGSGPLTNVNLLPNERNNVLLDLNAGLNLAPAGDPRSFARLTNSTMIYGLGEKTVDVARKYIGNTGPNIIFDEIVPFTDFIAHEPGADDTWYADVASETGGDGDSTVPRVSLEYGLGDKRIAHRAFREDGLLGGGNTSEGVEHTEIPSNVDAQKLMLNLLGAALPTSQISTGLYSTGAASVFNLAWSYIVDPVETAILTDGNGLRLGFSQATGRLAEIPNSVYFGAGDGIGWIFGSVVTPLQLEVVPKNGEPYFVQVQGNQGGTTADLRLRDSTPQSITVPLTTSVNTPPTLDPIGDKTVTELATLSFTATASDADLPANALTFSLIGAPAGATIDPNTGLFSWTPTETQGPGSYTFTVRVTDDGTPVLFDEQEFTIEVSDLPQAQAPIAVDDSVSTLGTSPTSIAVLANDSDPDGTLDATSLTIESVPANGSVTIDPVTGIVTYTPSAGFSGIDSFTYTVKDNVGTVSNVAMVTITVPPSPAVTDVRVQFGNQSYSLLGANRVLPWTTISAVQIVFSRDVVVDQNDLRLAGAIAGIYGGTFSYDPATFTAKWTLASPIGRDRLTLSLDGDGAAGDGNVGIRAVDEVFLQGGDFDIGFNVLPGDYNGDGVVTLQDSVAVRNHSPQYGSYEIWADLDGDGDVDLDDINAPRRRLGWRLP